MIVKIEDDFDIFKIAESGQCFRIKKINCDTYRAITLNKVCYIKQLDDCNYDFSCTEKDFDTWKNYFDLDRNYAEIRKTVPNDDLYMKRVSEYCKGIRILKQDAFEMIITFIISQRKSIPAIKSAVEKICEKYGEKIDTEYETLYTFPTVMALSKATSAELEDCGLGYRVPYVIDAVQKINAGIINLEELAKADNDKLFETLKSIHGIGDKVANCVLLFGYGRVDCAPVDVWIQRTIEKEYSGINPFGNYGGFGGIMQQYMFYDARNNKQV